VDGIIGDRFKIEKKNKAAAAGTISAFKRFDFLDVEA